MPSTLFPTAAWGAKWPLTWLIPALNTTKGTFLSSAPAMWGTLSVRTCHSVDSKNWMKYSMTCTGRALEMGHSEEQDFKSIFFCPRNYNVNTQIQGGHPQWPFNALSETINQHWPSEDRGVMNMATSEYKGTWKSKSLSHHAVMNQFVPGSEKLWILNWYSWKEMLIY